MDTTISFEDVREALLSVVAGLEKNSQYFNDLDSPIGDSDHGDSVCDAFKLVKNTVINIKTESKDIGNLLKEAGKAITFSGGAAMGPLYGTAFMDAGKAMSGKTEIGYEDLVQLWTAFAEGVVRRGGAKVGEKTMYDTLYPAVEALKKAFAGGENAKAACESAILAARKGMDSTKDMLSLRGRSSRLGNRSLGYLDPGSASMYTVISIFLQNIIERMENV